MRYPVGPAQTLRFRHDPLKEIRSFVYRVKRFIIYISKRIKGILYKVNGDDETPIFQGGGLVCLKKRYKGSEGLT